MRLHVLPLALLATTVLADGAAVLASIATISTATIKLNTTVANFPSGFAGLIDAIPLLEDSTALLNDINAGTKVASASANFTFDDTINVAQATLTLVADVQSVLTTIVNAKPKFDELVIISPVVYFNLKQQKTASDQFSAAVISKVPELFQDFARTLVAPIDTAFDAAIAKYKIF